MNPELILKQFQQDTENHTMKIRHNDGLYRHLEFSDNGSSIYRFDLITWPGCLTIAGDCGTFTFSRVRDMFDFFRIKGELKINPRYWQEKLQAGSCDGKAISEEFCIDKFKANVRDYFNSHFDAEQFADEKEEAWMQVEQEILNAPDDESSAIEAIRNFHSEYITFVDFFEYNNNEYKHHFIWCLYAIVFGIQQFDANISEATSKESNGTIYKSWLIKNFKFW